MRRLSKTKLIKDCRMAKNLLDVLIDMTSKGYFERGYSVLLDEKNQYKDTCKIKSCGGHLNYDPAKKHFYCNKCFKVQKLVFLGEVKSMRNMEQIDSLLEQTNDYKLSQLKEVRKYVSMFYRLAADDKFEIPQTIATEEEKSRIATIQRNMDSALYFARYTDDYNMLVSVINDGKLMSFEDIDVQIETSSQKLKHAIDVIYEILSKKNLLMLLRSGVQEEQLRSDLGKAEKKFQELLA